MDAEQASQSRLERLGNKGHFFCGYESHQAVLCAPGNKAVLPDHHHFTSREIAELTGKEHRNVMRDIRTMLVELHGEGGVPTSGETPSCQGVSNYGHTHVDPQNGQSYPIFKLPKRETLILVSGYSIFSRQRHDHDQPRDCGTDWQGTGTRPPRHPSHAG